MADANTTVINLDEDIQEHVTIILKGYSYDFRQPNMEEIEALSKAKTENVGQLLDALVTPIEGAPIWKEITKKMIPEQLRRLNSKLIALWSVSDANS